jgi:hypothetical protein
MKTRGAVFFKASTSSWPGFGGAGGVWAIERIGVKRITLTTRQKIFFNTNFNKLLLVI